MCHKCCAHARWEGRFFLLLVSEIVFIVLLCWFIDINGSLCSAVQCSDALLILVMCCKLPCYGRRCFVASAAKNTMRKSYYQWKW